MSKYLIYFWVSATPRNTSANRLPLKFASSHLFLFSSDCVYLYMLRVFRERMLIPTNFVCLQVELFFRNRMLFFASLVSEVDLAFSLSMRAEMIGNSKAAFRCDYDARGHYTYKRGLLFSITKHQQTLCSAKVYLIDRARTLRLRINNLLTNNLSPTSHLKSWTGGETKLQTLLFIL